MNKSALLAAVILGSAAFGGALQARPNQQDTSAVPSSHSVRLAAGEKREVEGTKADIKEDKAEAKAMAHRKIKHRRHHKAATHL